MRLIDLAQRISEQEVSSIQERTRMGNKIHSVESDFTADLLKALRAASGYLLNAKIDLETGAPKRTAIQTIEGGLKVVRAAIAKAETTD